MNAPLAVPARSGDGAWVPLAMQRDALACGAYELFLGGAAGPGKSEYLVVAPLRWVGHPTFRAVLFRNTFPELQRTLVEKSRRIYPSAGGVYNEARHAWTFPSGAQVEFAYLESDRDVHRYQGAEFQFCVALDTPVLMADGSWRAIDAVRVGDLVATLIGPRPVTATHRPGRKPVVRVAGPAGAAVVSASHRLLTSTGWASPSELMSTGSHGSCSTHEASPPPRPECGLQAESLPSGLRQEPALSQRTPQGTPHPAPCASGVDPQSGSAASGGGRREPLQPLSWSGLVALYGPAPDAAAPAEEPAIPPHALAHGTADRAPAGCRLCCPSGRRSGGEQLRSAQADARACTPSPADAAAQSARSDAGGQGCTPRRSREASPSLTHPYTKEALPASEVYHLAPARMAPAGEAEVADLTVAEASHYVTSGGFIAQNCGFDELPHFSEYCYRYMQSRLRSAAGIPIRLRATGNPDGPHLEWVRARFAAWIDGDVPAGESRWFSPDGVIVPKGTEHALSRCYIPGRLRDNPYLPPEYVAQLMALDPVTRAKLLDGDWDACAGEGKLFHRDWWQYLDAAPACARKVRAWDFGATVDGDPTEGVLIGDRGPAASPRWVVLDVVTLRGGPTEVHALVKRTAEMDGRSVAVCIPQDPGQAGVDQARTFQRELAGWTVRVRRPSADKVVRAGPFSSQVGARNVALLRAPWTPAYVAQLHGFPDAPHDDKVDASSDAFAELASTSAPPSTGHIRGF